MEDDPSSGHSIITATKSRAKFSGHGAAKGAAGFMSPYDESQDAEFLSKPGETVIINPPDNDFENFEIGVAWDNIEIAEETNFFKRLFKKKIAKAGIDLDLGCLYELQDGTRGCLQAFGESYGQLDQAPFIQLSGDERTGDADGHDEVMTVNGHHWADIKRIVLYIYIYKGASNWNSVKPQLQLHIPGQTPMVVTLKAKREEMAICAVAGLENIRGGMRMSNYLEYYPSHPAMDRAFGFGLEWDDGEKS